MDLDEELEDFRKRAADDAAGIYAVAWIVVAIIVVALSAVGYLAYKIFS